MPRRFLAGMLAVVLLAAVLPNTTMTVGVTVLPTPREAAKVQSIKAEMQYARPMTCTRFIPASMTAASVVQQNETFAASAPPGLRGGKGHDHDQTVLGGDACGGAGGGGFLQTQEGRGGVPFCN